MPKSIDLDATDRELLALLRENARAATADLARKLKLSRTTVQSRMERLQRQRVIAGYTIVVPDELEASLVRAHVLQHWDLEIGAGLGPLKGKIWRVGLMGASATPWHVRLCLTALCGALAAQGHKVDAAAALAAADAKLAG